MENDQKIFLLIDIERKYSHYRNTGISHSDAGKKLLRTYLSGYQADVDVRKVFL